MKPNPDHGAKLLEALLAARRGGAGADDVRQAFLVMGSETPDNVAAAGRIDYAGVASRPVPQAMRGLKVRGKEVLISDVVHRLEDLPMPEEIRASFPELDEDDWSAVMRLSTMIFLALEPRRS